MNLSESEICQNVSKFARSWPTSRQNLADVDEFTRCTIYCWHLQGTFSVASFGRMYQEVNSVRRIAARAQLLSGGGRSVKIGRKRLKMHF